MNIAIITSGHPPFDERIFYKLGQSIKKAGYYVSIICSTQLIEEEVDEIFVKGFDGERLNKSDKVAEFVTELKNISPQLVICCEPLTILASYKYKRSHNKKLKIISDVTEYYPFQNTLNRYRGLFRVYQYLRYFVFNIYASNLVDFIFVGEEAKAQLYKKIAPNKKKMIVGYYPPKSYFHPSSPSYDGKTFTLGFTGDLSKERGFERFINLVISLANKFPEKNFKAKIIGRKTSSSDLLIHNLKKLSNISVIEKDWVDYKLFSNELSDVDVCIDLRDKNIIFNRSLPIKIFDYMACGKAVIFSNLDSFKFFPEVNKFGLLIEPDDINGAIEKVSLYLNDKDKLIADSQIAGKLFEEKYNWELISKKMLNVINQLLTMK